MFVLEPPKAAMLPQWLIKRAAADHVTLQGEAAALLVELCGQDLGVLTHALTKVILHAGVDTEVSAEHVAEAVASTRIASIFSLTDAVGQRNWGEASLLLRNILGGGESPLVVLTMLTRQLRQLLQVKIFQQCMGNTRHLAESLGVRPFVADLLQAQARHYDMQQLQRALAAASATDVKLKSSGVDGNLLLDGLLVDMLAGQST